MGEKCDTCRLNDTWVDGACVNARCLSVVINKAEDLLSYFEHHGEAMTYGPEAVHREWWMNDAAALLRDILPEWSAYKSKPSSPCMVGIGRHHSDDVVEVWHGMDTPAVGCGFHATYYAQELYAAHRELVS